MPAISTAFSIILATPLIALSGCVSDGAPAPMPTPTPPPIPTGTTITVTSGVPPRLVVFVDGVMNGFDDIWQAAGQKSPTEFELTVNGPYTVTVVCDGSPTGDAAGSYTWQSAWTLDDPHQVSLPCPLPTTRHLVTGNLVQDGYVQLGPNASVAVQAGTDFAIPVPEGTYDLVATTADRIAVRRGIAVEADLALTPPIDLVQEGTSLANVAFTVSNAGPDDTLEAAVGLLTPSNLVIPGRIYSGPLAAKVAPTAALLATDIQTVSARATMTGGMVRSLRRPFRVGGDVAFTLPQPLGAPFWTLYLGELGVSWSSLPDSDRVLVTLLELGSPHNAHRVQVSRHYLDATRITHVTLKTKLPGYQPEWRPDLKAAYSSQILAQQGMTSGVLASTSWTISVAAGANTWTPGSPVLAGEGEAW